MKSLLEVEKNRISYHKAGDVNTVHRSSLIVPRLFQSASNISFLNHFLLKRNNKNVALKITAINSQGNPLDSLTILIDETKVYSFDLEYLFEDTLIIKEFLIEFYSNKNLYIPFPAVIVNHIGEDFTNCVHSFNRVLNDVFEDDTINKIHTYESSIDAVIDENYDTFFNFASGPFNVSDNLSVSLINESGAISKDFPIEITRLSNKNFCLSNIFDEKFNEKLILKVLQPKQTLFFGRLLAGRIDKKTLAFSANHSFYDSSSTEEYFDNKVSSRAYPYFSNCHNKIIMYPIMSTSILSVHIEIYDGKSVFTSNAKTITSPSNSLMEFDIDELVANSNFKNVTLFKLIATSTKGNIPTRVNHQLIYGPQNSKSKLYSSINVSLNNEEEYTPTYKTGLTWGQVLIDSNYESRLAICFKNNNGNIDEVLVDFYGESGLVKSLKQELNPSNALIFNNDFFSSLNIKREFLWFVAKSNRADIQAHSFHFHRISHNASGEHSF